MNTYVIGQINAMEALIKNLPLSLLEYFKGKRYDNMLDFILDVLYACGVDVEAEITKILCKIFKVDNEYVFDPNVLYDKLAKTNLNVESKFLDDLEDGIKITIIESILAILSCSAIPEIKNSHMDEINYKSNNEKFLALESGQNSNGQVVKKRSGSLEYNKLQNLSGYISIPLSSIDLCGKFKISPISSTGVCIYDLGFDSNGTYTATRAYNYFKVTKKGEKEPSYYLTKAQADEAISVYLSDAKNKSTDCQITEYLAGTQNSFLSYEAAINWAGYVEDKNSPIYKLLKDSGQSNLLRKSYYYKFVKLVPPVPASELYKSTDLDAFIWYSINRGSVYSQYEKNKMMWDNRRLKESRTNDNSGTSWEYWLKSKEESNGFIFQEVDADEYTGATFTETTLPWKYKPKGIFPIMQLYKDPILASENRLAVSIASQRYYRGSGAKRANTAASILRLNHTLYKFNYDYMRSIKIFSAKQILAGMLDSLLNGSLFYGFGFGFGVNAEMFEKQLSDMVVSVMQTDDYKMADCYFTFSNEEYDRMLYQSELNRYSAKATNMPGQPATVVDTEEIMHDIEEANTSASPAGKIATIERTMNTISSPVQQGEGTDVSVEVNIGGWLQILYNIIMAIVKPIMMCLFAPKVMLIFAINFYIAGLVDFNDENGVQTMMNLITNKLFCIIKSLLKLLIDKIIEMLLEIFFEYIAPILSAFILSSLIEWLEKWLKVLKDVLNCIPMFNWNKYKFTAQLDNVNYADIINEEAQLPENDNKC